MRKHLISTIFSVIAPLAVLAATDDFPGDRLVSFSSPGTDRYADGTIVPDGECYALVWSPKGKSCSGFNADGTAVSPQDRVVLAAPLAKNGKCRDTVFQVPDAEYAELEGGEWAVCLVDTRMANGVPAGVAGNAPLRVNRWGAVKGGVNVEPASASSLTAGSLMRSASRLASSAASATGSGTSAYTLSAVPDSVQPPRITALDMVEGVVRLTVDGTVPFLTYTISSGSSPRALAADALADKVDGKAGAKIAIETEAVGESRFFKVTRAE